MINRNSEYDFHLKAQFGFVWNHCSWVGKDGLIKKWKEVFLEMRDTGTIPYVVVYSSLVHGLYYNEKWE